jgi:CpeT protein
MIDYFKELIVGAFENKIQAFSHPSRYAFIRITHKDIGNGLFYGEQAYNYQLNKPYRQFVLEPFEQDGKIIIHNYNIIDKQDYVNFKNLDTLDKSKLELRSGCDVILEQKEKSFVGGLQGCDCKVDWMGRDTYLQNEIELTSTHYYVKDLGFCSIHGHQIWGSKHGRFEFARMGD